MNEKQRKLQNKYSNSFFLFGRKAANPVVKGFKDSGETLKKVK